MTTTVNVFYHEGLVTAAVANSSGRFSSDSVQLLTQPYLGSDQLSTATPTVANTTGANAGPASRLARLEVQPGKAAYVEINPPNRAVNASAASPLISGNNTYAFGPGWTISVLEAVIS
jgi:hypothetical protein